MNIPLIKVATTKTDLSHMYFWLAYKPFWFSCSLMSDSLWPHILQHTRLPHPLLFSGICSNSRPLSQWCHPTISSFTILFFCPQSFPASGSFPMSQLFASGGQSIGALDSVLMNSHLPWPQNYFYVLHLGDKQLSSIWNWLCGIFLITGVHAYAWMCVHVCVPTHPMCDLCVTWCQKR